jgi:hypothetical protein
MSSLNWTPLHTVQGAVDYFWSKRDEQIARLPDGGRSGGAARGNGHMRGIERLVMSICLDAGVERGEIKTGAPTLPGYFRAAKQWDLVVTHKRSLIAAIEFKSQVGSVGKNYNNRFEEALGSAVDVRAAHERNGTFGAVAPWLGYVFVLQESAETEQRLRRPAAIFPSDTVFEGLSYNQRYQVMIARLLETDTYQAAWFLTTKRADDGTASTAEPLAMASFTQFRERLVERIRFVRQTVG